MQALEISIWSAMAGALLLLATTAATDVAARGSLASWRGLAFVLLTGFSAVLMTGLPEHLLGIEDPRVLLPAKAALGPLSGALALTYLGLWLGIMVEDRLIRLTVSWGSFFLVVVGAVMVLWAWVDTQRSANNILVVSAAVNIASCVFAMLVAARGALLGDPLARQMAFACACLAGMVFGLYAKGLGVSGLGPSVWILTALCCVAYFLIVTLLTIQRNKSQLQLQRLASGQQANDAVTGLPTGVELLTQVDDALWRSDRIGRPTLVIAVWVANLYELSAVAGQAADLEIRSALSARMRRAVGFRNVVGLYHPRCYVVVISAVQGERVLRSGLERLTNHLLQPLRVGALTRDGYSFDPQVGFGVVLVDGNQVQPMQVMDEAERLAQAALHVPGCVLIRRPGQPEALSLADDQAAIQAKTRNDYANMTAHRTNQAPETQH